MLHTFFGGVHPAARKESTRRKPLSRLSPPAEVVIPLTMSAGGESRPAVRVGERVKLCQPIAAGEGGAAAAHASVSGRVTAIEERPHPWGGVRPAIVIENDGQDTLWQGLPDPLSPEQVTLELLLERTERAGVTGMGGGAWPAWEKLALAAGRIDTLIINAAECEPYVTADYRLLLERSGKILAGTQAVARCLGAKRAVVVTEGDKLNAAEQMERRLRRSAGAVELMAIRTRYPLGAERQIVQTATGRETPPGSSPLGAGCLVLNVATLYAIQDAVFRGRPLTHRAVTVSGGAVTRPRNLWAPIGAPLARLLEAADGLKEENSLMLLGGPMMGAAVESLNAPVAKNTSALLCLAGWERRKETPERACIRCGKCVDACPMHLAPAFIAQAVRANDEGRLARLHPEDCIGCGCCSYICPSGIPLVELSARAKQAAQARLALRTEREPALTERGSA